MKSNRLTLVAAAGLSILMLGSCNIYKKYELPTEESALIQQYGDALKQAEDSTAFGNLDWRTIFTDPVLQDLISQALENNSDLQNAKLNVDIANSQLKGARLSYLPSLAIVPNGSLSKYGDYEWSKTYQFPAQVRWEIDIFGKLLNSKRGAQEGVYRSEAYAQATRSQIIAAVANTYYAIACVESQIKLSRATAENWRQSVDVMKDLKLAGRVNEAAVVQSEAQYYGILASITDLESQLVQLNNTMSLLLNTLPQHWNVSADAALQIPVTMADGIPMRELASRPDVYAAERALAVAYYATNSARAAFYPGLNITANGGFTNLVGGLITNPGKWFIQLAGSLTMPLFSRGQNIARLEVAKAQQKQTLNQFENAILNAAGEVSDAITVYEKSVEKEKSLKLQTDALEKSVEYTTILLSESSGTSYLEVLTAQSSLLQAQMGLIACRQLQSQAVVNLYQSLGGGRK